MIKILGLTSAMICLGCSTDFVNTDGRMVRVQNSQGQKAQDGDYKAFDTNHTSATETPDSSKLTDETAMPQNAAVITPSLAVVAPIIRVIGTVVVAAVVPDPSDVFIEELFGDNPLNADEDIFLERQEVLREEGSAAVLIFDFELENKRMMEQIYSINEKIIDELNSFLVDDAYIIYLQEQKAELQRKQMEAAVEQLRKLEEELARINLEQQQADTLNKFPS